MPYRSRRAFISACSCRTGRRSSCRRSPSPWPACRVSSVQACRGTARSPCRRCCWKPVQEPEVDLGDVVDLLGGEAPAQGLGHHKQPLVGRPVTSRSSISSVYRPSSLCRRQGVARCSSRERMAFISAPSKELAMAMTSPVAFIWVPRVRLAVVNLSKGRRGIFSTQ